MSVEAARGSCGATLLGGRCLPVVCRRRVADARANVASRGDHERNAATACPCSCSRCLCKLRAELAVELALVCPPRERIDADSLSASRRRLAARRRRSPSISAAARMSHASPTPSSGVWLRRKPTGLSCRRASPRMWPNVGEQVKSERRSSWRLLPQRSSTVSSGRALRRPAFLVGLEAWPSTWSDGRRRTCRASRIASQRLCRHRSRRQSSLRRSICQTAMGFPTGSESPSTHSSRRPSKTPSIG